MVSWVWNYLASTRWSAGPLRQQGSHTSLSLVSNPSQFFIPDRSSIVACRSIAERAASVFWTFWRPTLLFAYSGAAVNIFPIPLPWKTCKKSCLFTSSHLIMVLNQTLPRKILQLYSILLNWVFNCSLLLLALQILLTHKPPIRRWDLQKDVDWKTNVASMISCWGGIFVCLWYACSVRGFG